MVCLLWRASATAASQTSDADGHDGGNGDLATGGGLRPAILGDEIALDGWCLVPGSAEHGASA